MNNEIGIQRDFDTKLMKYAYAVAKKLDEAALAILAADKLRFLRTSCCIIFN